ncbi:MAG: Acyl-coenzyme A:6-aminopenicillanic acid acyl-transferase [Holophagaceae bacterium]|nr:Acyl-coenzyme A:6-aminopenicillanic acid acyl-transferase [Holophagaceae bacterium]
MNKFVGKWAATASACLVLASLVGCGGSHSSSTTSNSVPEPYVPTGFPQVVAVSGTNHEMGVQYANQASAAIIHNLAIMKSKLYDIYTKDVVEKDMQVWDYYIKKHNPKLEDWMDGLQAGMKEKGYTVSHNDLMMIMYYPSELWCRPSVPYPAETGITNPTKPVASPSYQGYHSCNSFAAMGSLTPDGLPIHALDQMAGEEMSNNIILLAFPTEGASWVSQTFAGRVNANAAMNSHGFAWSMTAIPTQSPSWGLGESYFHYLSQYVDSPAAAIAYLKSTPRGSAAGGFMLSDASSIQDFESCAEAYKLRVPGDEGETGSYLVQTNHLVDASLQQYNFPFEIGGTNARYDTVSQYLKEAAPQAVDWKWTKGIFASDNWYDLANATWHYNEPFNGNTSNDKTSCASSIFIPSEKVAYLGTGTPGGIGIPASVTGEYVKIQLSTDPKVVASKADADALAYFWEAAGALESAKNANPYLPEYLYAEVKDQIDQSFAAYTAGIDRAGFAKLSSDPTQTITLWASALTYFAQAQLYAQMAKTTLARGTASVN